MAVGVIIGGAFSKIVTSLVNDIIMPIIGLILGGFDFKSLKLVLSEAVIIEGVVIKPESFLPYGSFIQNIVDFLIIAISIFLFIKLSTKISTKLMPTPEEKPKEPEDIKPTTEEILTDIKEILLAVNPNVVLNKDEEIIQEEKEKQEK